MSKNDFLDLHVGTMGVLGFWTSEFRESIRRAIELRYKTEVIQHWYIDDFILNGDRVLIHWKPRYAPLSEEELQSEYGRSLKTNPSIT